MGFLDSIVDSLTGQSHGGQQQQGPPPPVSPPWYAEWDSRENRWLFVNQQTYERTYNYPGPGNQSQGGYGQQQGGYGGYGQQYGGYEQRGSYGQQQSYGQEGSYSGGYPPQEQYQKKEGSNAWKYAAGGAAGLVGGALLMHEGEEIKQNWDDDKYRMEQRIDNFGNDAENFPENAANWAGQQVGNVENFGDRVENRWDNAVDNIEDFPEDAARWTGEKVQEVEDIPQDIENKWDNAVDGVEQFGDRMENAYDEGRDEQRYDDEY